MPSDCVVVLSSDEGGTSFHELEDAQFIDEFIPDMDGDELGGKPVVILRP